MTDEELTAIEARAEKASPAPIVAKVWSMPARTDSYFFRGPVVSEEAAEADAQFYAHARSDVPVLCQEVKELRAQLDARLTEAEACMVAEQYHWTWGRLPSDLPGIISDVRAARKAGK